MALGRRVKKGLDLTRSTPIYWVDGQKSKARSRTVAHKDGGGLMAIETVPQGYRPNMGVGWNQRYRTMVSPGGNVLRVALTCGASDIRPQEPQAMRRFQQKLRQGFVPVDECPVANFRMPPEFRQEDDKPCPKWVDAVGTPQVWQERNDGEPMMCEHSLRIIEARQEHQRKKAEEFENRMLTEPDKVLKFMKDSERESIKEMIRLERELEESKAKEGKTKK